MSFYRTSGGGRDPQRQQPQQSDRIRSERQWQESDPWPEENIGDPEDYETYAYEFSSQIYRRAAPGGQIRGASHRAISPKRRSPRRGLSPQIVRTYVRHAPKSHRENIPSLHDVTRFGPPPGRHTYQQPKQGVSRGIPVANTYSDDLVNMNHAAVKIQTAYRGYKCRKDYWKRKEQRRREMDQRRFRKPEPRFYEEQQYTTSTPTLYEDYTVTKLAHNADPNLGLLPPMHPIDMGQKNHILREWKLRINFSDDIPTISHLLDESGPTILLCGGINPFVPRDYFTGGSMFVYNPQKDKWFFHGTMPEPRNYHCAVYLHGRVYISGVMEDVLGGGATAVQTLLVSRHIEEGLNFVEARNQGAGCICSVRLEESAFRGVIIRCHISGKSTRAITTELKLAKSTAGGVITSWRRYGITSAGKHPGGYSPFQTANGEMLATATMYQLSIRSKRWRKKSDMHQARACHAMCVLNDCIVVVGGRDNTGKILSSAEHYDPIKDQWSMLKPMPEPLMGMGATVLDEQLWVIGGITCEGGGTRYPVSNRVYYFDLFQRNWFKKQHLPEPRAFCSATTLRRELWIWGGVRDTLGGDGRLVSTGSVHVYSTDYNKWEQHFTLSTPKHATALAKGGHRMYILGGITSFTKEALSENDMYDREHDTLRDGAALPRPLTGCAALGLPVDYLAKNENKWIGLNRDEEVLNAAATKIQALYRGYATRSGLTIHKPVRYSKTSPLEMQESRRSGFLGYTTHSKKDDYWKTLPNVSIAEWPPKPDPNSSTSAINISLGGLPLGYTIVPVSTGTRVRRYLPLPTQVDPNLGIYGYLDDVYKKAKRVLGLRRLDPLPAFAHEMKSVDILQDDSVPVVLLIGGMNPKDPLSTSLGKCVMRYHPLKDRYEFVGLLPEARNHHAATIVSDTIYITGGYDPDVRNCGEMVATNTTYCLSLHSNDWVTKADMMCARAHHGMVHVKGRLYVIGGRDSNGRLVASVEAYDIESDKWHLMHPMTSPRLGMACTVYDDAVWVLGGIGLGELDGECTHNVLASVIAYDPTNDSWSTRPPLRCPRAFATSLVTEGQLWIFGGCSKSRIAKDSYLLSMGAIDFYHAAEAQWIRRTFISSPRHCAATVAVESCVYMFGGISSQEWSALSRSEMIITEKGSVHATHDLPVPMTGIAAVTINPVIPALRSVSLSCLLDRKLSL